MKFKPLFSRKSDEWRTPQWLFDTLNDLFHFDIDVACTDDNAKVDHYFTVDEDGLTQPWVGTCWMNPPYSQVELWMKKAWEKSQKGATVVCLVPSRTDTYWWSRYADKGDYFFIEGRLKFNDAKQCAPFPSAIIVFNGKNYSRQALKRRLVVPNRRKRASTFLLAVEEKVA